MAILTTNDFPKGKFELHTGMYAAPKIQSYIDLYEKRYLIELFGKELYDEFEADLTAGGGVPTEARFTKIWEPLAIDCPNGVIQSEGIKEMLKGFIYYEFAQDKIEQMTSTGNRIPTGENSKDSTTLYTTMYSRYNLAVKDWRTIQYCMCIENPSDYSNFNGNAKAFNYWI